MTANFDYTILKEFCKVRNNGKADINGLTPTPRMNFIMELLNSLGIEFYVDEFFHKDVTDLEYFGFFDSDKEEFERPIKEIEDILIEKKMEYVSIQGKFHELISGKSTFEFDEKEIGLQNFIEITEKLEGEMNFYSDVIFMKRKLESMTTNKFFNIVLPGTSKTMFIAHHDVYNHLIDNCNDNSASIINLIALKTLMPEATIVFTDGEELGGIGAERLASQIKLGVYGHVSNVLNLELTALGGSNFVICRKRNDLYRKIKESFVCEAFDDTLMKSDTTFLNECGVESCVITTLPKDKNGSNNFKITGYCHKEMDSIHLANFKDMQEFVESVLVKLV